MADLGRGLQATPHLIVTQRVGALERVCSVTLLVLRVQVALEVYGTPYVAHMPRVSMPHVHPFTCRWRWRCTARCMLQVLW